MIHTEEMKFQRVWAMPTADTFDCEPIKGFVQKYLMKSKVSIDPFARNKCWADHTNDLNPDTAAQFHMDAEEFIHRFKDSENPPDLILFDPPYSINQIVTTYKKFGIDRDGKGTHNGALYSRVRNAINEVSVAGTIVLSFGWNSCGMGKGWETLEILLVCHGGAHNDTICMAQRKREGYTELFP